MLQLSAAMMSGGKKPAGTDETAAVQLSPRSPVVEPSRPRLLDVPGPGLITGASDDDPSGIATYSQAGAQFGYGLAWTMLFTYPLMAAVQISPMAATVRKFTVRA